MKTLLRKSRRPGDIELVDLDIPRPGPAQILARVSYAGICSSDLDILNDKNSIYKPPVVQGHEYSAVVTEVGKETSIVSVGDKIVAESFFTLCGHCQYCIEGNYQLCQHKEIIGWTKNGAFAEYVLLNSNSVHVIDKNADLKASALIEPFAVASEAVHVKGRIQKGETIAVIGPGVIGIASALVGKAAGAEKVFLIGRDTSESVRFPIAKELGLDHCINSAKTDPLKYIDRNTGGRKLDMVIDATGNIEGFKLALDFVKRNGRIVEVGSITGHEPFPWSQATYHAIDLIIVFSSSKGAWKKAIEIFSNSKINFVKMITHEYSLEEFQQAFALANDSTKSLKVVFKP